mmetsp:Transcript_6266/g.10471  ORF Transcript_6266/g.10471 Transcript_6266/m.10471 type:complete len:158 (+) Transcript_6266:3-476(+)
MPTPYTTTELPYVMKFLVTRMKLIATKHVSGLTTLFGDVCSRDDIRILTQEDFIALFPARRASSQHELLHRNCVSLSPELTQFDPQPCDPYTQGNLKLVDMAMSRLILPPQASPSPSPSPNQRRHCGPCGRSERSTKNEFVVCVLSLQNFHWLPLSQ